MLHLLAQMWFELQLHWQARLLVLQDAVREGSALLQKTAAAGKAANSCLGSMGAEEAAPQGQLLEKLLRDSEELQSQLVHGLPAGQVRYCCWA